MISYVHNVHKYFTTHMTFFLRILKIFAAHPDISFLCEVKRFKMTDIFDGIALLPSKK